ncbi:MAG: hypothetical protein JNL01_13795 [Bdellovibrionales bacterium]|nr:hypothetical protein [Bdellovibrionales bacterium]
MIFSFWAKTAEKTSGMKALLNQAFALIALGVFATGCTNLGSNARARSGTSTVTTTDGSSYGLSISQVLLSPLDASSGTITIVGTNPGDLGAACDPRLQPAEIGEDGEESTETKTPGELCSCTYRYIRNGTTGASDEQFSQQATYAESNIVRCSFPSTSILAGIPYVDIQVRKIKDNIFSNPIRYNLTGGEFLDPTSPNSFVQVNRYQCRDRVRLGLGFQQVGDGAEWAPYNPILSEDPKLSYPLNFYYTNYFQSMQAFIALNSASGGSGEEGGDGGGGNTNPWICPTVPNDPNVGMQLGLFSVSPDSGGSIRIFPPTGSVFDRSTFFLARKKSGIFTLPVNAYGAPGIPTSDLGNLGPQVETDLGSLGYGVPPIVQTNGTETCPDTSVPIPAGFRWVKVWQFRASLSPRQQPDPNGRFARSAIMCNPGNAIPSPTASGTPGFVFGNCEGGTELPVDDSRFASRAYIPSSTDSQNPVTQNACLELNHPNFATWQTPCNDPSNGGPGSGAGCTATNTGTQKPAYASMGLALASDIWYFLQAPPTGASPSAGGSTGSNGICGGGGNLDNMNLCSASPAAGYPTFNQAIPFSTEVNFAPLDPAGQQRYDFVYTVSPTTVNLNEMLNPGSTISLPYVPYRFYPGGCVSGDPNNPAFAGDCSADQKISYGIKIHDVGQNGDSTPGSTGRPPVFPVCALQPI